MKDQICYIVGAGENHGLRFVPKSGDYVIAADAGLTYLQESGIRADLAIGDFDTLGHEPDHPNTRILQEEKDDTDTLAAIRAGIDLGYQLFHIYCGMGGQVEHTLANIQALIFLAQRGLRGFLFGKDCVLTAMTDGSVTFSEQAAGNLSVFALSDTAKGVYLRGLKYELDNAVLTPSFPVGVSNRFIGRKAVVTVTEGTILMVFPPQAMGELVF